MDDFFLGIGIAFGLYAVFLLLTLVAFLALEWIQKRQRAAALKSFTEAQRESESRRYVVEALR